MRGSTAVARSSVPHGLNHHPPCGMRRARRSDVRAGTPSRPGAPLRPTAALLMRAPSDLNPSTALSPPARLRKSIITGGNSRQCPSESIIGWFSFARIDAVVRLLSTDMAPPCGQSPKPLTSASLLSYERIVTGGTIATLLRENPPLFGRGRRAGLCRRGVGLDGPDGFRLGTLEIENLRAVGADNFAPARVVAVDFELVAV